MTETSGYLDCADGSRLAWRSIAGREPTVVWLGGYRSDMSGTKAEALADAALAGGWSYLRFDYFAHGASSGEWEEATIGRWKTDALAVIRSLSRGPLVLVGSSMGGWIACLVAREMPERVAGLLLVAPAADFTETLMRPAMNEAARAEIEATGRWMVPSDYGEPYPVTREFLDEGRDHLILGGPVPIRCPVRILQGARDPDVPWAHALKLAEALESEDVVFALIKDGDHRLSRPQDLRRLLHAVEELAAPRAAADARATGDSP